MAEGRTLPRRRLGRAVDDARRRERPRHAEQVAQVLEDLRAQAEIPDQTDRLFVVDTRQIVRGSIPFHALVRADPSALTREVMLVDVDRFEPDGAGGAGGKGVRKVRPRCRPRWWMIAANWLAG